MKTRITRVAPAPAVRGDGPARGPMFVFRRAHQIANAVFAEACSELELTPSQYTVLFALRHVGPVGQNELGRAVMLDRCTTSIVVRGLEEREFVRRVPSPSDLRKVRLSLTDRGRLLLARAERMSARAHREMLSVLSEGQAQTLFELLERFTRAHESR